MNSENNQVARPKKVLRFNVINYIILLLYYYTKCY